MAINWNPTGRPIIFYEPHQDDGVLFMAQVAAHHMLANREVHVVLMSNGRPSSALQKINGEVHSGPWWGGFHDPLHEGYEPLTPEQFGDARTRELINSWNQLGVPNERIHIGPDLPNNLQGSVGLAYIRSVINNYRTLMPDAGHYSMHWEDPSEDHANIGWALRGMKLEDSTFDTRWLVKPEEASNVGAQVYNVPADLLTEVKTLQFRAAVAYGAWAPDAGSFAIGYHSVYTQYFQNGPLAKAPNWIVKNP